VRDERFRADLPAHVFALGLSSFFAILLAVIGFFEPKLWMTVRETTIGVVICAVAFAWVRRFEIRITETELVFRSLFGGTERMTIEDVGKAELKWETGTGLQGPLRLVITPTKLSSQNRISINAKVFSRKAVVSVLDIARRNAQAGDSALLDGIVMRAAWNRRRSKEGRPTSSA
jgi:hypothetical protein